MRLPLFIYLAAFLCSGILLPNAYGQVTDTIDASQAGKIAKSDELYFAAIKAKMHDDDKLAISLLEQFIAERPKVSAAYYDLSMLNYRDKNSDQAEQYIRKAIELDYDNKWYQEQYASILADRGDFLQAAKIMGDLAVRDPDDPSYLISAADNYEHAKKYEEAISYIDKALEAEGPDEDLLERKVQLYLDLNDVDKAAGVVKDMIARDTKNGKYYKLLGDIYDNNKMPEKAAEVYQQAQKIVPDDPSVELGMAIHYLNTGDTVSYTAYVKKAILNNSLDSGTQLDMLISYVKSLPNDSLAAVQGLPIIKQLAIRHPDDPDILSFYGDVLAINNQNDSSQLAYKKTLTIKPADFTVWGKLLGGYADRRYADSLVKYSQKAIRLFPNQGIFDYYNAIGHFNKNEYATAIKAMNRGLDLLPDNEKELQETMYRDLADIYHANKQDDLSDQAFDKALKITPNDATVLNNYSYYLSERGVRMDDAERMSKKSLEIRPREATFLDTYGWILYREKDYAKAKEYIQKAIELSGPKADATLYDHLGNVYYKLNEKDKAIENWKISKEKGCEDPQIDKKISEGKLYE